MDPSESPVPLEVFQRHLLLTHLKNDVGRVFDEIRQAAEGSGEPIAKMLAKTLKARCPQSGYQDDNWFFRVVRLESLYFAHTDFRLTPVPKNDRFVDYLEERREDIEASRFVCSEEIRAPLTVVMPESIVQEREPGKYYVLDGQLRVIRHWYHRISFVMTFIYRGNGCV